MDDINRDSIDEEKQKKLDTEDLYWQEVKNEYDFEKILCSITQLMIAIGDNPSYKVLDELMMVIADLIPTEMWERFS